MANTAKGIAHPTRCANVPRFRNQTVMTLATRNGEQVSAKLIIQFCHHGFAHTATVPVHQLT
jgi:hypothetical protein